MKKWMICLAVAAFAMTVPATEIFAGTQSAGTTKTAAGTAIGDQSQSTKSAGTQTKAKSAGTAKSKVKSSKSKKSAGSIENAKNPAAQRAALVAKLGVNDPADVIFKLSKSTKGFEIKVDGQKITILGGNDNDLVAGYGYYLRNVLKNEFSWSASRTAPAKGVPAGFTGTRVQSPWKWRYAYNYCTLSYTSGFWGKKEWADEIDRMALFGVNHALVQAGLEKVWQLTLDELKYPKANLAKFVPAPCFAAWWNMGNLEGHGGPLSQKQIDVEAALGKFIVQRMQNYGITPIVQGFTGLVPADFLEAKGLAKFNAKLLPQGNWVANFKRPDMLDPTNAAFPHVAAIWYKNLKKVYGFDAKNPPAAFGGDLFHEGGNDKGVDVPAAAKAIQAAQQKAAPGAIWVLQAWQHSPRQAIVEALDKSKTMVVVICKDMVAGTQKKFSYWGAPWTWCEVSNFGGNHGLYGSLRVMSDLSKLAGTPENAGIGIIPEGTEVNPFFYDFVFDRFWVPADKKFGDAEIDAWIGDFVARRYGNAKTAAQLKSVWQILEKSVYRPNAEQEGCTESILCATPARNVVKASTWSKGNVYWNGADVQSAFEKMIAAGEGDATLAGTETFRWDLCDVGRQFLADLARPLLKKMMDAFDAKNQAEFDKYSKDFLALIDETDRLLATHELWRFGRICDQALAKGTNKNEKEKMLRNAKMLVTTWSEKTSGLENYSHRQLAGIMKDCYGARWKAFVDAHGNALRGNDKRGDLPKTFEKITFEWRDNPKKVYSAKAEGNTLAVAKSILKKFGSLGNEIFGAGTQMSSDLTWSLADGGKTIEFDVTDFITAAGTFSAKFERTGGNANLDFVTVKLFEDDKEIDSVAWPGGNASAGTVSLKVVKIRSGLGSYTLKVERKSSETANASGTLKFEKQ